MGRGVWSAGLPKILLLCQEGEQIHCSQQKIPRYIPTHLPIYTVCMLAIYEHFSFVRVPFQKVMYIGALMNYPCLFCPSDNFEHCLALPTRWRASVRALFYWYMLGDPRRCEINRKVHALRHVGSATNCHLDKTSMDKSSMHMYG